ncbi:MAG: hypothetical protein SPL41_12500 [Succinivibrionaceae bacterium]|jgi:hypothetical protein|nr:hypothetical protein [Succinivibrionaceae bacterium]MDY6275821.1 hypothetical protein [Succinivibrionaceae bacterium]MDY6337248.1 hypothetical protein [Succinivibrionaceae bacterium]MDY6374776.1 hypothetical protein [Succinivibrionaceae bacterium]
MKLFAIVFLVIVVFIIAQKTGFINGGGDGDSDWGSDSDGGDGGDGGD